MRQFRGPQRGRCGLQPMQNTTRVFCRFLWNKPSLVPSGRYVYSNGGPPILQPRRGGMFIVLFHISLGLNIGQSQ